MKLINKAVVMGSLLSVLSFNVFGQTDSLLTNEVSALKDRIKQQTVEIEQLNSKYQRQRNLLSRNRQFLSDLKEETLSFKNKLDSVSSIVSTNENSILSISKDLGTKIQETGDKAESKISVLNNDVGKNRLYWIIGTLVILLIGGIIFWLLGKRISSSKIDVESQIKNTKQSLEEESIKLDSKLVEVLESQLKIQQAESNPPSSPNTNKEDHSLALKVADEIVRMQKNISRMEKDTKGLKPLEKSIERIQANFSANGYEMINLLNKDYEDRMNIDVINFIDDESLEENKKIITKIIKPQVNHNGVLIQRAQVEVSQNH